LKSTAHQIGAAESARERDLTGSFIGLFQQPARRLDAKPKQIL
jgi:hypothetical protein